MQLETTQGKKEWKEGLEWKQTSSNLTLPFTTHKEIGPKDGHSTPREIVSFSPTPYYKGLSSQSYGFSSSHVYMWELDNKEGWALKNWCFWTVVLEKTLETSLDCKEIQPVHPKGN